MYKLFLCLRYLRKRRIAFFAVGAVSLCVAMVLIVVSVMGGFLEMVKDRSRGMLGDLVVENQSLQGFPYYEEFIDELKRDMPDRIEEATPVIITYGVLRFPTDQITKYAQIVGIRLEETYRVNEFREGLFYETYYPGSTHLGEQKLPAYGWTSRGREILPTDLEAAWQRWYAAASPRERAEVPIEEAYQRPGYYRPLPVEQAAVSLEPAWIDRELPGAILGADIAARRLRTGGYERYYYRGSVVHLMMMPFTPAGRPMEATGVLTRPFRYADDSRTGVYDIDSTSVYVDFDLLQQTLRMDLLEVDEESGGGTIPPRTTQVQIKLKPGVNPVATQALVQARWNEIRARHDDPISRELLDRVTVLTWEEKQAKFIEAVEKEKLLVTILFGVVSLVAVLLVGCIFYMIVQQKTRDIGIVKSVGATSLGVANIFVSYGAAVGVVGGALGTVLGAIFVWYINDLQDLLRRLNPNWEVWNPEVYAFDRIPNQVAMSDVTVIYAVAIVASMVGSLIAAWRAARVWPVEALRYE